MTTAPVVLVIGAVGASTIVASATHDLAVQWVSAIVIAGTLGGFAWVRKSLRTSQREEMVKLLEDLGLIERPHPKTPRAKRGDR
jgi:hypothetical protein